LLPSAPIGVVPGETAGRSETGRPDIGETPGWTGAVVMPGGRVEPFDGDVPGASGVAVLLDVERLGIELDVFGVPGAAVVAPAVGVPALVVAAVPPVVPAAPVAPEWVAAEPAVVELPLAPVVPLPL
jgi:hypothetical protein